MVQHVTIKYSLNRILNITMLSYKQYIVSWLCSFVKCVKKYNFIKLFGHACGKGFGRAGGDLALSQHIKRNYNVTVIQSWLLRSVLLIWWPLIAIFLTTEFESSRNFIWEFLFGITSKTVEYLTRVSNNSVTTCQLPEYVAVAAYSTAPHWHLLWNAQLIEHPFKTTTRMPTKFVVQFEIKCN